VRNICQWVGDKVACSGRRCNRFLADRHAPIKRLRTRSANRRPLALWPEAAPAIPSRSPSPVTVPYEVMGDLRTIGGGRSESTGCLRWNERESGCRVPGSQAACSAFLSIDAFLKSQVRTDLGFNLTAGERALIIVEPAQRTLDDAILLGDLSKGRSPIRLGYLPQSLRPFPLSSSIATVRPISIKMKNERIVRSKGRLREAECGNGSCWCT
jgi:hypothetical protein